MGYPIDAEAAGRCDKYGQVYVENCGREFTDREEPVAVLRQIEAMRAWRDRNPEKVRAPGTQDA